MSVERYTWVMTGVIVLVNAALFRYRAELRTRRAEAQAGVYCDLAKGFAVWLLPPIAASRLQLELGS